MATILVVDDNAMQQRMFGLMLKRKGYDVATASNGLEALQVLTGGTYDLVLADLDMPVMDGLTLLQRVREHARFKDLPFVMLTASGMEHHRRFAGEHGVNIFLTKPTDSRELVETIGNLLG